MPRGTAPSQSAPSLPQRVFVVCSGAVPAPATPHTPAFPASPISSLAPPSAPSLPRHRTRSRTKPIAATGPVLRFSSPHGLPGVGGPAQHTSSPASRRRQTGQTFFSHKRSSQCHQPLNHTLPPPPCYTCGRRDAFPMPAGIASIAVVLDSRSPTRARGLHSREMRPTGARRIRS